MKFYKQAIRLMTLILLLHSHLVFSQDNDFKITLDLYNNQLYSIAHQKFLSIINQSKNQDTIKQSYYYAALSSYHLQNYKNCISEFTSFLINIPNSEYTKEAQYYIAASYFYLKNYTYAIKNFRDYISEFPEETNNIEIKLFIAKSYFYMEYYEKALSLFEVLLSPPNKKSDITDEISYYLGLIHYQNSEYKEALKYFNNIIKTSGQNELIIYASFYLGLIHNTLNSKEESLSYFQSVDQSPSAPKEIKILSKLYISWDTSNMDDLSSLYNSSKDKNLKSLINILLIQYYYNDSLWDEIKEAAEVGLKLNRNQDIYYHYLYLYYLNENQSDQAKEYLELLIDSYPQSPYYNEAKYNYAVLLYQENEHEKARSSLLELKDTEDNPVLRTRILYFLSEIEFKRNSYDNAGKYLSELLKIIDEQSYYFTKSISLITDIYIQQEEFNKIINLLSKKKNLNYEMEYKLALAYLHLNQYNEALPKLENILENSKDPELNYKTFLFLYVICQKTKNDSLLAQYLYGFKDNKYMQPAQFLTYLLSLAEMAQQNQNYQESNNHLIYSLTLNPTQQQKLRIYSLLLKNYQSLNQRDKIRETINTLILLDPDNETYLKMKEDWETNE